MAWFERAKLATLQFTLNTGGTVAGFVSFPNGARILSYSATPTLAGQAAHASIVDKVIFTLKNAAGSGSTVLAKLTNDSDEADAIALKSSAWTQWVPKKIETRNRPGSPTQAQQVFDEIPAGYGIAVELTGEGSTPTANNFTVAIEYLESD